MLIYIIWDFFLKWAYTSLKFLLYDCVYVNMICSFNKSKYYGRQVNLWVKHVLPCVFNWQVQPIHAIILLTYVFHVLITITTSWLLKRIVWESPGFCIFVSFWWSAFLPLLKHKTMRALGLILPDLVNSTLLMWRNFFKEFQSFATPRHHLFISHEWADLLGICYVLAVAQTTDISGS